MGNPFYGKFGNNNNNNNQFANLIKQFNQFKKSIKGDPKQQVQELLNSGQMTQEQFNQIQGMARQLQGVLK